MHKYKLKVAYGTPTGETLVPSAAPLRETEL